MLSPDKNELLTRVGPGTPMGDLLRRYWMPIAGISEFDGRSTRPLRLMGEDLVLYKDLGGRYGLVDRRCAHRRADLAYGMVEQEGLRCNYHGWRFDAGGHCIERPLRGHLLSGRSGQGPHRAEGLSGQALGRHGLGLHGAAAGAGAARVGSLLVARRLCPGGDQRGALQLVPVPGEFDRPGALRMDARELGQAAAHPRHDPRAHAPEARLRGVRLRLHLPPCQGRQRRAGRGLDRRPRLPVAERLLPRRAFRMAGADRRREHAERDLEVHPRAEGARALRAAVDPDLVRTADRCRRQVDRHAHHEPGLPGLGRPGPHRRPVAGAPGRERPRHRGDPGAASSRSWTRSPPVPRPRARSATPRRASGCRCR